MLVAWWLVGLIRCNALSVLTSSYGVVALLVYRVFQYWQRCVFCRDAFCWTSNIVASGSMLFKNLECVGGTGTAPSFFCRMVCSLTMGTRGVCFRGWTYCNLGGVLFLHLFILYSLQFLIFN